MPNIRLRMADDLLLSIPAHAFRLLEAVSPGANPQFPEAKAILLYDIGDNSGVQSAWLATSPEVVAECVEHDPQFHGRLTRFDFLSEEVELGVWLLPQNVISVIGVRPSSEAELAELQGHVDAAAAAVASGAELSPEELAPLQARVDQLKGALAARRSLARAHTKISVSVPSRSGDRHSTYFLASPAEAVVEVLEPTPRKPDVQATPVREPKRRSGRR